MENLAKQYALIQPTHNRKGIEERKLISIKALSKYFNLYKNIPTLPTIKFLLIKTNKKTILELIYLYLHTRHEIAGIVKEVGSTTRKTGYCGGPKPPLKPKKAPLKVPSTYCGGCFCGGPSRQCCSAAISRLRRQQKAPLQMSLLAAGEGLLRRAQNRRHMCSKFVALAFSGGVMPAAIVSTFQRRSNSAAINNKSKQLIVRPRRYMFQHLAAVSKRRYRYFFKT